MSGIFGVYYFDGQSAEPNVLQQMSDTLAHRGSDGADIWYQDNLGLGHRLLWTTPESLIEIFPLEKNNLVITADARIDNRNELISALEINHFPKEKITDSEIILAAYQKWGEQCPEKLIGDFAFAIWNKREQKLFCARDPMGIKPFYYYHSPNIFVFASEIKALFCLSEVPRKLNELKVAYYLEMFCEEQTTTFYQDIFRLPSAKSLSLDHNNQKRINSYWSFDPKREIKFNSDTEYIEAFQEIFFEAVNCRLRSAFPVGSTLSGGMDSSSITCTARHLLAKSGDQQLHTFSAIFPSLPEEDLRFIDERCYMDKVKSLAGLKSHDVRADLLNPLIDILWQDEEPISAPNLYIHQGLYQCANQQGVRVFLDGIDGDSTISHGWSYLTELAYTGRWSSLIKEVNAVSRRCRLSRKLILQKYVLEPLFIQPFTYLWQWLQRITHTAKPIRGLVNVNFAQKVRLLAQMQTVIRSQPALLFSSRQNHWLSLATGLYPHVMEIADKTAARSSIEARYPFLIVD
ncbi:MAG: lasso peptide isopeptide bond-forming cyclase [Pleurocapsa sp. CRU_1_2]|nr:lasso peptide isopeptide bond-forming cyclase [Pleurocapsa sp. CRU_1_2]